VRGVRVLTLTLVFAGLVLDVSSAQALTIKEYPLPTSGVGPDAIALGSDGNVWFTEDVGDAIGRITPTGTITEFPVPTSGTSLRGIAAGPDGNLWFTEFEGNKIGRISTAGTITEFTIPTANAYPWGIAAGPDGKLWFTEPGANKIGRISTSGVFSKFPIPSSGSGPVGISAGSDGNMWFTESGLDQIGRITTSGTVTEFAGLTSGSTAFDIAPGSDTSLWFTEENGDQIGRITTSGTVSEFSVPTPSLLRGISPGPDGNLWFTETALSANNVANIDTSGATINEFATPTSGSGPEGIGPGADGAMWFTEYGASKIGTIGQPTPNILNVYYIPNFFIKKVAPVSNQGEMVRWLMLNPGTHGIADSTGMHLFGFGPTGGPMQTPIGQMFSYSFKWAGAFAYDDPFHPSTKGKVKVPIAVQLVVGTTDQARVTWASGDAPAGFAFDVQVKQPGSSSFTDWRAGVTELNGVFGPSDPLWVGPGTYSFRARIRQLSGGRASGYSRGMSISLS
jgi:virginiamycin B lyase